MSSLKMTFSLASLVFNTWIDRHAGDGARGYDDSISP